MTKDRAREVLRIEQEAILSLIERIDKSFEKAIELILKCRGRVIVSGVGKSGIIASKLASTLASTGTPAFFLHPTESLHGDIGMATKDDLFIIISNSGSTEEIKGLIPSIKRLKIKLIALCGKKGSFLAKNADVFIDVSVKKEACPFGFIPTASTTAALAMGDAIAICLLEKKGLTPDAFALLHPAGALGKKLNLLVSSLMHKGEEMPIVNINTPMKEAILEMTKKRLGMTIVVDKSYKVYGIITDGDLRRHLEKENLLKLKAKDVMTKNPKAIEKGALAIKALKVMEDFSITSLVVKDKEDKPLGVIHIHDIIKAGI
ncbi:MAG: KpsF/GutQ family sugar-phosphate isomerase [bacterium]